MILLHYLYYLSHLLLHHPMPFALHADYYITRYDYGEHCVMNNYFGIGLDAKITLDFHLRREEHPEKCRSRTRNMML